MQILDPPRHTQVRDIFTKTLRPSLVRSLKPRIAKIASDLLDEIEPGAVVDFVASVGRIPAALMTELIGVPRDQRERFIEMASAQVQALTMVPSKGSAQVERNKQLLKQLRAYCDQLLEGRRGGGSESDDLVSTVLRSQVDGEPVGPLTLVLCVKAFISAGETTRDLLSFLAWALAERPDQRRLLVNRPELISNALEETLRYSPPSWMTCRTATQQVQIGAHTIKAGDYVVLAYASASRDEDVFERPDAFDITRSFGRDHLGFGYGVHACPGALLARIDSQVIWEGLVARFSDWELVGAPKIWSTPHLQGMTSLPLRFGV